MAAAANDESGGVREYQPILYQDSKIKRSKEAANSYYAQGNERLQKHDLDGAIADYDKAISLDPENVEAYYKRGVAEHTKGSFDAAIEDFTAAIRLNPKHIPGQSISTRRMWPPILIEQTQRRGGTILTEQRPIVQKSFSSIRRMRLLT